MHDAYTAKLATKNTAIVHFRAKQTELWHLHANESILAAFQNAGTQIFSIIQKAVTTHYCISLKSILQGTARVPTTGDEKPNPWDKQSLCDIICIMHDRFHKRSFVTFTNNLLDAMGFHLSEADTKSNPMKANSADDVQLGISQSLDPDESRFFLLCSVTPQSIPFCSSTS